MGERGIWGDLRGIRKIRGGRESRVQVTYGALGGYKRLEGDKEKQGEAIWCVGGQESGFLFWIAGYRTRHLTSFTTLFGSRFPTRTWSRMHHPPIRDKTWLGFRWVPYPNSNYYVLRKSHAPECCCGRGFCWDFFPFFFLKDGDFTNHH